MRKDATDEWYRGERDGDVVLHVDPYLSSIGDVIERSIHDESVEVFREATLEPNKTPPKI